MGLHNMNEPLQADETGLTLLVRVSPRSATNRVAGIVNGAIRINLTASPVEGAANEMLIEFLAKLCHLPKSDISLVTGYAARQKRLRLEGAGLDQVKLALGL